MAAAERVAQWEQEGLLDDIRNELTDVLVEHTTCTRDQIATFLDNLFVGVTGLSACEDPHELKQVLRESISNGREQRVIENCQRYAHFHHVEVIDDEDK